MIVGVYIVTVENDGEERAMSRNEIASLLRDHVEKHPHFEEYGEINIDVEEG